MSSESSRQAVSAGRKAATPGRLPRGKGTDHAYLTLRDLIVRMELAPGDKIDEGALAKKLGVSRTPLREAVVRLSADRLATISPNHGASVAPLDALGLTQYFESLELTHRALQHWACLRRTPQDIEAISRAGERYERAAETLDPAELSESNQAFHHAIAAAAKNEFFAEYEMKLSILGMRIGWLWYRDVAREDLEGDVARTVAEHKMILRAIEQRQAERAEALAQQHIVAFRDRVFANLSRSLGGAVAIRDARRDREAGP